MEIKLKNVVLRLDFSFLILLSFAVLYGYSDTVNIILFSLLHEIGHILMLLIFKVKAKQITVSFYGIGLKYNSTLSRAKEIIVLISGPAVNLFLFAFLKDKINLILLLINILPLAPLDGGRILLLFSDKLYRIISVVFLIMISALAVYLFYEYRIYSLMLIDIYLIAFNLNNNF